ncbi:hypothetical protein SeLEV6574_g01648 [Synchytrium endobioticum]|uniref:Sec20 C-terminal domain-containing protein n=1 Tax=Synchytrium endobioticum TaxID=286115 RepID=A0A507DE34_9FUNG|nr:hypothetical protein SeLEV6574_g01648 [Synchytrium endobioticum]
MAPALRDTMQKQLDSISKAELLLKQLVDELANPNERLIPSFVSDKVNKIRGLQSSIGRTIEHVKESAWDEDDTQSILRPLQPLEDQYEHLTGLSRKAIITANRNIQLQAEADRKNLITVSNASAEAHAARIMKLASQDAVVSASNDLTESMREALKLMSEEVQKSAESTQVLTSSTDTLAKTSQQYTALGSAIDSSKRLVTSMSRRDLIDRGLIVFGLVIFLAVVAHIVKKRVWIPGVDSWCTAKGWLC